jgi:hypothetical protein
MAPKPTEWRDPGGLLSDPRVAKLVEEHHEPYQQYREASLRIFQEIQALTGGEACGIDWEGVDGEAALRTVTVYRVEAHKIRKSKERAAERAGSAGGQH